MLSAYRDLNDRLNRLKEMDSTKPAAFGEFLNFTLEKTATPLLQIMTVLQQYMNIMCIFRSEANDKRMLPMKKNKERLARALAMTNMFFFQGAESRSASVVTTTISVNSRLL